MTVERIGAVGILPKSAITDKCGLRIPTLWLVWIVFLKYPYPLFLIKKQELEADLPDSFKL